MTNRKSQNSILFLTTLGVYLGLVLVGATPQVLAQAATTRSFDISEEVGQVENPDKDPGKDRRGEVSVATKIRRSVTAFLAEFSHAGLCEIASKSPKPQRLLVADRSVVISEQSPGALGLNAILSPQHLARASI